MDGVGRAVSAVRTLLAELQRPELKNICSIVEYKSQFYAIQGSVEAIELVLRDFAEIKQEFLSHQERDQIHEIQEAIYEAEDLFDEFVLIAAQKQLLEPDDTYIKRSPLTFDNRVSQGLEKIKKNLDAIYYNNQFSFKHDPQPIRNRRPDTCSYAYESGVIGRENELEKIVGMLLDPSNDKRDVSFLSIVGRGGLGKTTLAQLVFNDPRITSAFSWRKWTCVGCQDQIELDVKQVLCKILGQDHEGSNYMERVQSIIRKQLAGQRYLIILDDVWFENRNQWCDLVKYLAGGQRGCWIMVTTRSHTTAMMVDGAVHELQIFSKENCWRLFEQMAFTTDQSSNPPDELVEIGRKIVDGCARFPLAVKVAGSLLYGQDRSRWQSVQIGLASLCMQKPELSKHNRWKTLSLTLRAIARMKIMVQERYMILYCLLFGDIYEFEREKLIQLWMAAGFLTKEPLEDNGDRIFNILLEKKYILPSRIGISRQSNLYKVNSDMIPDVRARADSIKDFNMKIRDDNVMANQFADVWHISVQSSNINQSFESLMKIDKIKTLLLLDGSLPTRVPPDFFSTLKFLTALDLSGSRVTELPSSIQDAKELCYVDLSGSPINRLPQSIVHLRKLQTLRLKGCTDLFELPERTMELSNLRHLDFDVLSQLTLMPRGIGHLTELRTLHAFIVDGEERCNIQELKLMNNLSGTFCISGLEHASSQDAEEATLIDKKCLKHLELRWSDFSEYFPKEELVRVIEGLKPHSSLEELKIVCYFGECLPNWMGDPQYEWLVSISLFKCENCSNFPCLGRLPQLNNLEIFEMNGVKKIDHTCYGEDKDRVAYHALEKLSINGMYRVEEWKGLRDGDFPCLVKLIINRCPNLALLSSFPRCQSLKHLELIDCPQLECLPDDMLSSPLDSLVIDDCPLLKETYSKGGEDSHKIEHVKNVWIELEETESSDKHSTSTEDDDSIEGTHHEENMDEYD
ncbi:disease resistance protein RGA2-like [Chenopodium quinoa]|uniref:Uncharacterized protein n=1 Tax=Chenopodium quinoa TaxID=63459 RepID=A0A803MM19_CHEQI|nr:disease resistance protein RGA2-like [Chenopodium quinoa]